MDRIVTKFRAKSQGRYGKRHKPGEMNKTEEIYAAILEARKLNGEVISWEFEPMTLKLTTLCTYTPDFMVFLMNGEIEMVDTKGAGPLDDKGIVKIKMAAEKFWMFRFVMEKRQTKKNGGGWDRREF